jgi:hypothetical protein
MEDGLQKKLMSAETKQKLPEIANESYVVEQKMLTDLFKVLENYQFEGLIQLISPKVRNALNRNHNIIKQKLAKNGLAFFKDPAIKTKTDYDNYIDYKISNLNSLKAKIKTLDPLTTEFRETHKLITNESAEAAELNKYDFLISNWVSIELKRDKLDNMLLNIELNSLEERIPENEFNFFVLSDFTDVFSGIEIDEMLKLIIGTYSGKNYSIGEYTINSRDLWLLFICQTYKIVARIYAARIRKREKLLRDMSPELIDTYTDLQLKEDTYIEMSREWGADIDTDGADETYIRNISSMGVSYYNNISVSSPLRKMNSDDLNKIYPECVSKIKDIVFSRFVPQKENNQTNKESVGFISTIANNFNNLLVLDPATISNAIKSLNSGISDNEDLVEVVNTVSPDLLKNQPEYIQSLSVIEKSEIADLLRSAEESIYLQYQNLEPDSLIYQDIKNNCDAAIYSCKNEINKNLNLILQLLSSPKESYRLNSKEGNFLRLISLQLEYPLFKIETDKISPTLVFKEVFSKFIKDSINTPNIVEKSETDTSKTDNNIFLDEMYYLPQESLDELDKLVGNQSPIKNKIKQTLENFKTAGSIEAYIHGAYCKPPKFLKQGAHKLHGYKDLNHIAFKFTGSGMRLVIVELDKSREHHKYQLYIGDYHDSLSKARTKLI